MEQPALFDVAAVAPELKPREQAVLDFVNAHPDGISADEAGAAAHGVPGPRSNYTHDVDTRCKWCPTTGKQILEVLIDRGLVKRKRVERTDGVGYRYVFVPVNAAVAHVDLGGPGDLPDGF